MSFLNQPRLDVSQILLGLSILLPATRGMSQGVYCPIIYSDSDAVYTENIPIATPNVPTWLGSINNFHSSPLPQGILLDPSTGAISGIPTARTNRTSYAVNGSTVPGGYSCNGSLHITVKANPTPVAQERFPAKITLRIAGVKHIDFDSPRGTFIQFSIVEPRGKTIWAATASTRDEGDLNWNGTRSNGQTAARGVYIVGLTAFDAESKPLSSVAKTFIHSP